MERIGSGALFGWGIKAMALARFSLALEALLNAGVDTPKAWSSAAYASGSPMLAREMKSFGSAMERGRTPSEWLQEARFFPDLFKMSYATGELSGKVDENLQRLIQVYAEEGSMKLQAFFSLVSPLDLFDHCVGRRLSDSFLLLRIFWWSWHLRQYE